MDPDVGGSDTVAKKFAAFPKNSWTHETSDRVLASFAPQDLPRRLSSVHNSVWHARTIATATDFLSDEYRLAVDRPGP